MKPLLTFLLAATLHAETVSPAAWWSQLNDPHLTTLIETTLRSNFDLKAAAARVQHARALRGTSKSALMPSLDASANANRLRGGFNQGIIRVPEQGSSGGSLITPFETNLVAGSSAARWELDLFGRLRKGLDASTAELNRAEELRRDLQLLLTAETARTYFELRGAQTQRAVIEAMEASEAELLELTRVRADAGLATQLDVDRQAAQLAQTRAALPPLRTAETNATERLHTLTGGQSRPLIEALRASAPLPAMPDSMPHTAGAELLERRPDLRAANARILAAMARAGMARAELYPRIVLTGLLGRQGASLSSLSLGAGSFFGIGPSITLPIFNAGRIRSQIAAEQAAVSEASAAYEQEVLAAFEESERALAALRDLRERHQWLQAAQSASREALALSRELHERGLADFLSVLDAERALQSAELALAQTATAQRLQLAATYQALGGGW